MTCAWCAAPLVDRTGEPRFELFTGRLASAPAGRKRRPKGWRPGELIFVCYERCPPPTRRIVTRYALFGDPDMRLSTAHVPTLTGAGEVNRG